MMDDRATVKQSDDNVVAAAAAADDDDDDESGGVASTQSALSATTGQQSSTVTQHMYVTGYLTDKWLLIIIKVHVHILLHQVWQVSAESSLNLGLNCCDRNRNVFCQFLSL